ncbi:hypothetical protein ACMT1E_08100 [Sphingomonas flavalba]|uniref:hypothetical protein n=1 Tax=Sphingomonas flavalba TaxID=2559804 RepID=UPI0039E09C0C
MTEDPILPAAAPIDSTMLDTAETIVEDNVHGLRERAGELRDELRDKAESLWNSGVEFARERPYAAAAVVGGVAATAAAAVYGGSKLAARRAGDAPDETPSAS